MRVAYLGSQHSAITSLSYYRSLAGLASSGESFPSLSTRDLVLFPCSTPKQRGKQKKERVSWHASCWRISLIYDTSSVCFTTVFAPAVNNVVIMMPSCSATLGAASLTGTLTLASPSLLIWGRWTVPRGLRRFRQLSHNVFLAKPCVVLEKRNLGCGEETILECPSLALRSNLIGENLGHSRIARVS